MKPTTTTNPTTTPTPTRIVSLDPYTFGPTTGNHDEIREWVIRDVRAQVERIYLDQRETLVLTAAESARIHLQNLESRLLEPLRPNHGTIDEVRAETNRIRAAIARVKLQAPYPTFRRPMALQEVQFDEDLYAPLGKSKKRFLDLVISPVIFNYRYACHYDESSLTARWESGIDSPDTFETWVFEVKSTLEPAVEPIKHLLIGDGQLSTYKRIAERQYRNRNPKIFLAGPPPRNPRDLAKLKAALEKNGMFYWHTPTLDEIRRAAKAE